MTNPAGFKTFADDVVLTASEINGYLMQGILVFADSAARDTALSGSLAEGRYCYLKDTNTTYVYTGSSWEAVTGSAAVLSGTTGSPATSSITGFALTKWTSNGSFTVSKAGLVTLMIAAGGGGGNSTRAGGAGGYIIVTVWLEPGTYDVVIGAGGPGGVAGGQGGSSRVGLAGLTAIGGGSLTSVDPGFGGSAAGGGFTNNVPGQGYPSNGTWGGAGAGGTNSGDTGGPGVTGIDGGTYCQGGDNPGSAGAANTGDGGGASNHAGGSGAVILAQAV